MLIAHDYSLHTLEVTVCMHWHGIAVYGIL